MDMCASVKTVLITGASSGIGYYLALEFASRGYHVFAGARRLSAMEPLIKKYPGLITAFVLDVTSLDSINNAYMLVVKKLEELDADGLDVLYNNAGLSCTIPAIDVPDKQLLQCMDTNFNGPVRVTHVFSKLVIKKKGCIAFTGSMGGYIPLVWGSIYSASKAALGQYASVLALEMEPFDVSVKNFITGGVNTDINDDIPIPDDSVYNNEAVRQAFVERKKLLKSINPTDPVVYVKQAIDEIEFGYKSVVDVYLAKGSIFAKIAGCMPRWILLSMTRSRFHLNELWTAIRRSQK